MYNYEAAARTYTMHCGTAAGSVSDSYRDIEFLSRDHGTPMSSQFLEARFGSRLALIPRQEDERSFAS